MPLSEERWEEGIPIELELPPPIPSKPRGKQKAQEEVQPPSPPAEVVVAPAQQSSANPPPVPTPVSPTMSARRWAVMAISIIVLTVIGAIYNMRAPAVSPTSPVASSTTTPTEHPAASPVLDDWETLKDELRKRAAKEEANTPGPEPSASVYPSSTSQSDPTPRTYRVVNTERDILDSLPLRQGPGSDYPVVVNLSAGLGGITLARPSAGGVANNGTIWQEILVQGYTGWVDEAHLEAESAVESAGVGVLEFQGDDVGQVLRLLARQAKVKIVVSERVTDTVTMRLEGVTALQAISIIVKAKGLFIDKIDNVYYIKTAAQRHSLSQRKPSKH